MSAIIHCPYCHSDQTVLIGLTSTGLTTYKCDYCGNRWSRTAADDVSDRRVDAATLKHRNDEPESSR
jgi:transposase-like protein